MTDNIRHTDQLSISQWLTHFKIHYDLAENQVKNPKYTPSHCLDSEKIDAYSTHLRRSGWSLAKLVRVLRGESPKDPRPNKHLFIPDGTCNWSSFVHKNRWECIVRNGVVPNWKRPLKKQKHPPANHPSISAALNSFTRNIRKGQDAGQYLLLHSDLFYELEGIFCSPLGAVVKGDADISRDCRIIHDLSYPSGRSVNDATDQSSLIEVQYNGPIDIAHRLVHLSMEYPGRVRMMTGDVAGAFRHIPINAEHVGYFAGVIPELNALVINLSCPFGWSSSPAEYWVAGLAIKHVYESHKLSASEQP